MRPSAFLALILAVACRSMPATSSGAVPAATGALTNSAAQLRKPYVVLISYDGFRADYLKTYRAPTFARVAREGVRATGMIPVFPSKTFPNHYSLVTGVYPAKHGIVGNKFWDAAKKKTYTLDDPEATGDGTWYRADPIWVSAGQQGMVTASLDWVGAHAAISGIRPARYTTYRSSTTQSNRADSVLAWLALPDSIRPHLILVYNPDVDHAGHNYGPSSPEVASAIAHSDSVLATILDGISRLPIAAETYVILVADHGMTEVSRDTYLDITTMIDTAGVFIPDGGPVVNLHVRGGKARAVILRDSLNRKLAHGHAYLRKDVPARFHYRSDPRIGDLVVIMDEHWQIGPRPTSSHGQHGFDNALTSMQAIFLARGPGIKPGRTIAPFENIEVYSLVADLLGIATPRNVDSRRGFLKNLIMQ